jgi:hypothetical protein
MCDCWKDWYTGPIPCGMCQLMDSLSRERETGIRVTWYGGSSQETSADQPHEPTKYGPNEAGKGSKEQP